MDWQPLLIIVIGFVVLAFIWRLVKGVIRLVVMLAVLALVAYFAWRLLQ